MATPPKKNTSLTGRWPAQPPKRPKKRISRASCGRWDIENQRWNPHPKPQAVRALLWTWVSIALEGEHSPQEHSPQNSPSTFAWRKREWPTCLVGPECSWISLYTRNHCNSGKSSFVELWGRNSFSHIGFFKAMENPPLEQCFNPCYLSWNHGFVYFGDGCHHLRVLFFGAHFGAVTFLAVQSFSEHHAAGGDAPVPDVAPKQ